jgi:hypothetical protein
MIMRIVLSLMSLYFGVSLVLATAETQAIYESWGYTSAMMRVAGLVQILASIGLWLPKLERFALLPLWSIVTAAFVTHWRLNHDALLFLPSLLVGGLILLRFMKVTSKGR